MGEEVARMGGRREMVGDGGRKDKGWLGRKGERGDGWKRWEAGEVDGQGGREEEEEGKIKREWWCRVGEGRGGW